MNSDDSFVQGQNQDRNRTRRLAAVVLNRTNYGEADLIVTFLTRELGLVTGLARYARRSQKRFGGGLLSPGTAAWYDFRIKPDRELAFVERGELNPRAARLPDQPLIQALAAQSLELVKNFEAPHNPSPEVFDLLVRHLSRLAHCDGAEQARRVSLDFTFKYMELAGFGPHLDSCLVCGAASGPDRPGFWDARAGGLYCGPCLAGLAHAPGRRPLSPALLAALTGLGDPALLSEEDLWEAELFFEKLAEHQGGRPLKSFKALQQLLRSP